LGEEKAKGGVDPDALTEFLKNEGITDELKDSESGDDDTTNAQGNILVVSNTDNIIISIKEGVTPSEVEIDGKVDKDNLLSYKVSVNGKGTIPDSGRNVDTNNTEVSIPKSEWKSSGGVFNTVIGKTEETLDGELKEAKENLEVKQTAVASNESVTQNIKDIKELEKEIEKLEKDLIKAKKQQPTVKVTAFFTKNKQGSKQTVEFTYNGTELIK
jgi:hypothetical protein